MMRHIFINHNGVAGGTAGKDTADNNSSAIILTSEIMAGGTLGGVDRLVHPINAFRCRKSAVELYHIWDNSPYVYYIIPVWGDDHW